MADDEWLAGLKVGDEVVVTGEYGRAGRIVKIGHATAHFLLAENSKYRRRDGRAVSTDTWSRKSLLPVTDAIRERIDFESAVNFLQRITWDRVPREIVFEVRRLYRASLAQAEAERNGGNSNRPDSAS